MTRERAVSEVEFLEKPVEYVIGVMKTPVENKEPGFDRIVDAATKAVDRRLTEGRVHLRAHLLEFTGPHLTPAGGAYSPLDFLQIGIAEKLERKFHFLLIVTEVDLASTTRSYTFALPSQLTNIGIVSTKRLRPEFWGRQGSEEHTARHLETVMLHTIGHLLNVPHSDDPANIMYDFHEVADLDRMTGINGDQVALMRRNLPIEARERVTRDHHLRFTVTRTIANFPSILRAVARANPLSLALHLPAVITAAVSVDIVLFFTAEIWDVASTFAVVEIGGFALISFIAATAVFFRAFSLGLEGGRGRLLAESAVVSRVATILTLLLTVVFLFALFFFVSWAGIALIFPERLMATWPTVDPATKVWDHVKLATFLAAVGVLAGSLGGAAERKDVIRQVLFLDEET